MGRLAERVNSRLVLELANGSTFEQARANAFVVALLTDRNLA